MRKTNEERIGFDLITINHEQCFRVLLKQPT